MNREKSRKKYLVEWFVIKRVSHWSCTTLPVLLLKVVFETTHHWDSENNTRKPNNSFAFSVWITVFKKHVEKMSEQFSSSEERKKIRQRLLDKYESESGTTFKNRQFRWKKNIYLCTLSAFNLKFPMHREFIAEVVDFFLYKCNVWMNNAIYC